MRLAVGVVLAGAVGSGVVYCGVRGGGFRGLLVGAVAVGAAVGFLAIVTASSGSNGALACVVGNLDRAAGFSTLAGFSGARCAGGWALGVGSRRAVGGVGLFRERRGRWVHVTGPTFAMAPVPSPLEMAPVWARVNPLLLERLARPFALPIRQAAAAGVLVAALDSREHGLKATGLYQVSPVISVDGEAWLVLDGANSAPASFPSATEGPYPDGTIVIYRWTARGWTKEADVRGFTGPIGGCCGISPVALTGSRCPDFAIEAGGAADTNWLSIVSAVGGAWHLVPFDYGYADSTVVNGIPARQGVGTEVDGAAPPVDPRRFYSRPTNTARFAPRRPAAAQRRATSKTYSWLQATARYRSSRSPSSRALTAGPSRSEPAPASPAPSSACSRSISFRRVGPGG